MKGCGAKNMDSKLLSCADSDVSHDTPSTAGLPVLPGSRPPVATPAAPWPLPRPAGWRVAAPPGRCLRQCQLPRHQQRQRKLQALGVPHCQRVRAPLCALQQQGAHARVGRRCCRSQPCAARTRGSQRHPAAQDHKHEVPVISRLCCACSAALCASCATTMASHRATIRRMRQQCVDFIRQRNLKRRRESEQARERERERERERCQGS